MRGGIPRGLLNGREIEAISFKPNGDWPLVKLHERNRLEACIDWIGQLEKQSRLRSAPPRPIFEGEIVFEDGERIVFYSSAILSPQKNIHGMTRSELNLLGLEMIRDIVVVEFPSFDFKGSAERLFLADLIQSKIELSANHGDR